MGRGDVPYQSVRRWRSFDIGQDGILQIQCVFTEIPCMRTIMSLGSLNLGDRAFSIVEGLSRPAVPK